MKLLIPQQISKKINWWLTNTPTEWSGVAYYSILESDDTGFPTKIELSYFNVLDIGSHSETEWKAEALAKAQLKFFDRDDVDFENTLQGLIHSHHSMGSFFSSTDKETMQLHVPDEHFYISTIVSNPSSKCPFMFGVSYVDQYGFVHIQESDKVEVEQEQFDVPEDWLEEIKAIKERKEAIKKAEKDTKSKKKQETNTDYYPSWFGGYNDKYDPYAPYYDDEPTYKFEPSKEPDTYLYRIGNEFFIRDLDRIPIGEMLVDSNDVFLYNGTPKIYGYQDKLRIKLIRRAIDNNLVHYDELMEWCKKHDININEFNIDI